MACVAKTWHLSLTCHMHFQGVVFVKEELLTVASRPRLPNISTDPIPKLEDLKLSLHQTSTFYLKLPFPKACSLDVLSSVQSKQSMGHQVICFQVTGNTKLLRDLLFQLIHRVAGSQKLPRQRPTCHQWCRRCVRSHDILKRWHVAQRCGVNIWLRDLMFVCESPQNDSHF